MMEGNHDICIDIGLRIKDLRTRLNISQEELAFRSGVHRTYIGGLEVGKRNVSIKVLEKIVRALEVTLSQFFETITY